MKKKMFSFLLALALTLGLTGTALAVETGFSDVPADAAYSDAVAWCRENGIMNGTSDTVFSPNRTLTRAMLATVLHRAAGTPAAEGSATFTDNDAGTYYHDAVVWAASAGILSGYGNGRFGSGDLVTRQQLATILWRYDGEKAAEAVNISDRASVSGYAATAVDWAVGTGVMAARSGSAFAPGEAASRAETASALYALFSEKAEEPSAPAATGSKVLTVYFSRTNNTKGIAEKVQAAVHGDTFEIVPQVPYTDADINYNDSSCRANREQSDPSTRPAITGTLPDLSGYEVIFLGYPIWHGQAPKVVYTFLENSQGWNGQTVIPFCTSGSSPIGSSASNLHSLLPDTVRWMEGNRFNSNASQSDVTAWVNGLNLNLNPSQNTTTSNREEESTMSKINLSFNGHDYTATLADNSSAEALKGILENGPLTINMSDYASMEKVGPIGQSLPTNNEQITTQAGDLILYQGSNLVIYYAPNSWNFTRLGRIDDPSGLRNALGSGNVSVTLTLA